MVQNLYLGFRDVEPDHRMRDLTPHTCVFLREGMQQRGSEKLARGVWMQLTTDRVRFAGLRHTFVRSTSNDERV
jgi:hypothetical protein